MSEEQVAKLLQQLPASAQFAIVNCLPNLPYGASWGLCKMEEVKEVLKEIKSDKNLFAMPVRDGVILQVAKGYLESVCNGVCKGIVTSADLSKMNLMQKEAFATLDAFLGKKATKGVFYNGYIGIYCTNMTPNIRLKDVDYPAFRVDLPTALQLLNKYGYSIVLEDAVYSAQEVSILLTKEPVKLSRSLIMSPSMTGVFMKVTHK